VSSRTNANPGPSAAARPPQPRTETTPPAPGPATLWAADSELPAGRIAITRANVSQCDAAAGDPRSGRRRRACGGCEQTQGAGGPNRLGPAMRAELDVQVAQVGLDRAGRDGPGSRSC